jgi:CysZ protein
MMSRGAAFVTGLAAPWRGFVYMCRNPALWRYGVIPVLLNLLINVVLLLGLVGMTIAFTAWFHPRFKEFEYGLVWEILTVAGLIVLALGVTLATWKLLEGIFCGHYYGKLAAAVELQLGLSADQIHAIPFRAQLTDALRGFVLLVTINLGCLTLNCVPIVGSIAGLVVALYCDASILGRNYLDFPLSLRGRTDQDKKAFARQNRFAVLGLGTVALVFNFLPVIGAVVLTTATTGAVLLHRQLESDNTPN